jgi:hypothetical protein
VPYNSIKSDKAFQLKKITNEANSLCRVDRPVSIHLVCQRSCVFGLVAHCFEVSRDVVELLIANPWPFRLQQKVGK